MSVTSTLKFGRTPSGYLIRIEGRGTAPGSWAVSEFVARSMEIPDQSVFIDLSDCEYLDSTFLGCLVDLHKRFGLLEADHFVIVASPEKSLSLLGSTRLNTVLHVHQSAPAVIGEFLSIPVSQLETSDFGRHVMECHRRLADLGGSNEAAFRPIVNQLARELELRQTGPKV